MRGVPGRKLTRYTDLDRAANLIELAPGNLGGRSRDPLHLAQCVDDTGPIPVIISVEWNAILAAGHDARADLLDGGRDAIDNVVAGERGIGQALVDDARRVGIDQLPILGGEFGGRAKIFQRIEQAATSERAGRHIIEPAGVADSVTVQV